MRRPQITPESRPSAHRHADAHQETQNVAQNVSSSTKVSSRTPATPRLPRADRAKGTVPFSADAARRCPKIGTVPGRAAQRRLRSRHRPQCRKILSITLPCGGSIKAITSIVPPHCGQASGSTSYTADEHAQVWSQRPLAAAACTTGGASRSAALRRMPPGLVRVPAVIANQGAPLGECAA